MELVGGKRYSWCACGHSKKQVKPHLISSCITHVFCTLSAYSLIQSSSFSLSVMEPTKPKPKVWCHYASSQRKTAPFGCVVASPQTTHHTAMARTSRTSLCLPHYMSRPTLKKEGGEVFDLNINLALASTFCYWMILPLMKAAHENWSTMTSVWLLCHVSISQCLTEKRVAMKSCGFLSLYLGETVLH